MEKLKSEGVEDEGDGDSWRVSALRGTTTRRQAAAKAKQLPRNIKTNSAGKSEESPSSTHTADQSSSKTLLLNVKREKGGTGVEENVAGVASSEGIGDSWREDGGEDPPFRLSFQKGGRAKKGRRRGTSTPAESAGGDSEAVTTSSPLSPPTKDVTSSTNQDEVGESERRTCVPARLPAKPMIEKPKLAPMLLMNNLPYMGELTFDTRPRRGRKPKKADICHLISKNYGIQFPNSYTNCPNTGSFPTLVSPSGNLPTFSATLSKKSPKKPLGRKPPSGSKRSGGDCGALPPELLPLNSSFSSCGKRSSPASLSFLPSEQRSSQPAKNNSSEQISRMYNGGGSGAEGDSAADEPLNLCLRDSSPIISRHCPTPQTTFSAAQGFNSPASPVRIPILSNKEAAVRKTRKSKSSVESGSEGSTVRDAHLVNSFQSESSARKTASRLNNSNNISLGAVQPLGKIQRVSAFSATSNAKVKGKRKRSSIFATRAEAGGTAEGESPPKEKSNKASQEGGQSVFGQQNSGSRAEVSICKFKFTGGAKPSLQEKKMLSVDSGGNFRFYTDKATPSSSKSFRASISSSSGGTEFGQDSHHYPLSSLPKSAKSMSMCMPVPVTSMTSLSISKGGTLSSFCQLAKPTEPTPASLSSRVSSSTGFSMAPAVATTSKTKALVPSGPSSEPSTTTATSFAESPSSSSDNSNSNSQRFPDMFSGHRGISDSSKCLGSSSVSPGPAPGSSSSKLKMKRKRRTRKSLMREKLEKTFKEKGFLIQTQQLESAEGATYCKFRQLRKFTRYLFRSWKDYLPDNVKDIQRGPGTVPPSTDTSSPTSPPLQIPSRLQVSVGNGEVPLQRGLAVGGSEAGLGEKRGWGDVGRRGGRGRLHKSESSSMEVDGEEEDDERESEGGSEDETRHQEMFNDDEEGEEEPTSSYRTPSRPDSGSDEEVDMDEEDMDTAEDKFGYRRPAVPGLEEEEEDEDSGDSDNGNGS